MRPERSLPTEPADAALVKASLAGDRQAFPLLIARHAPRLRRRLWALLRLPALIDELAHEACVTAWRRLDRLHKPGSFGTWLCEIGVRLVLKWYRRDRTDRLRHAEPLDGDGAAEEADPRCTQYDELERRAGIEQLRREIRALPVRYRRVFELHYQDELSCDDIARRLEISIAAVHQRLSRGRDLLASELVPAAGVLGSGFAAGQSPDAFVEAVMRTVRRQPLRRTSPARAAGSASATLRGSRAAPRSTAALLGWLVPALAVSGALYAAHAVLGAVVPAPPDQQSPGQSRTPDATVRPAAARPPPGELPPVPGEAANASSLVDEPEPDYVVRSEHTRAASALGGAHELRPMDAYGRQLYPHFAGVFAVHFAMCLWDDVVGHDDYSRIEVDLRFTLWSSRERESNLASRAAIASARDVTYELVGLPLSTHDTSVFWRCLNDSLAQAHFPAPDDDAPRTIRHHLAIDFGVIAQVFDAICAAAP